MSPALLFLPLLLAQAGPSASDAATQNQAFIFLGGLVAVAVMANQVMGAVVTFRKIRGADPNADTRYATRQEHEQLRDEVSGIKADVSALIRTINNQFADLQRSIGRLEGKLEKRMPPGPND